MARACWHRIFACMHVRPTCGLALSPRQLLLCRSQRRHQLGFPTGRRRPRLLVRTGGPLRRGLLVRQLLLQLGHLGEGGEG